MSETNPNNNATETVIINADKDAQWKCMKCDCISTNEEVQMVECDLCEGHMCLKCGKISQTHYRVLNKVDTMWFCSTRCTQVAKNKLKNKKSNRHSTSDIENRELENKITESIAKQNRQMNIDLQKEISTQIKTLEDTIFRQLDKYKTEVEELNNKTNQAWSDVVKRNEKQTDSSVNTNINNGESLTKIMQDALVQSQKDQEMKEEREKSIIIYNLDESDITNRDERVQNETNYIDDLCRLGIRVGDFKIDKIRRLGRFDKDAARPRPMKVTLENREQQQKIINNLSNLRQAEDKFKKLSIATDMTQQERQLVREKHLEAKRLSQENENSRFVVKGYPNNNLRIVEIKKK